uniref:Uncharacterized protein n=1 Tax=Nelumbo nucifera TaxID=4432 RepID=A0A822YCR8_NELNU|nr:TPA_asm: hypothetical protein HUJ06_030547 [Nelumbo nucifera]
MFGHIFDFLFATQDASTSSLLWALTLLDSHPDVLVKARAKAQNDTLNHLVLFIAMFTSISKIPAPD